MTVRNSTGDVIQFMFGGDGLDPTYMEGNHISFIYHQLSDELVSLAGCWLNSDVCFTLDRTKNFLDFILYLF